MVLTNHFESSPMGYLMMGQQTTPFMLETTELPNGMKLPKNTKYISTLKKNKFKYDTHQQVSQCSPTKRVDFLLFVKKHKNILVGVYRDTPML